MEDTVKMLGKLVPDGECRRDAVHVAVVPLTAGRELYRGGWFVLAYDGTAMPTDDPSKALGVVDPFLTTDLVGMNQRFWGYLKPGTITSLRHIWSHPAFTAQYQKGKKDE